MACMHKKTFKILHNDYRILPDDYVEIDELIAPTIQVLNQKGYVTQHCCSGHPLDDWLMADKEGYRETGACFESYIVFEEGITLPALPTDFVSDFLVSQNNSNSRLSIKKSYYIDNAFDNQFYEKAKRVLKTMEQLYQWALDLPDFSDEASHIQ